MFGGTTNVQDATDEIVAFCKEVKAEVEAKTNKTYDVFTPLKYKSQVVAGTNYFVKVQINDKGDCIHIRLFEPLPCNKDENSGNVSLHSVQENKTVGDELQYF